MAPRLAQRFGLICHARRLELDLTQVALAAALGMSRSYYAAIEAGQANPSANTMDRIAETLGLRLDVSASAVVVVTGSRVLDAVHARCSGYVTRRLKSAGWLVLREVEISDGRLRGWIDVLAFDPRTSTLLVIEIKTSIEDLGRLERQVGWYTRAAAASIPADRHPARVVSWVLALASAEIRPSPNTATSSTSRFLLEPRRCGTSSAAQRRGRWLRVLPSSIRAAVDAIGSSPPGLTVAGRRRHTRTARAPERYSASRGDRSARAGWSAGRGRFRSERTGRT
jgi:transcriptional regulator with XRE-family HTH domain